MNNVLLLLQRIAPAVALLAVSAATTPAHADDTTPKVPAVQHGAGADIGASNVDATVGLSYRVRFAQGVQLDVEGRYADVRTGYLSGYTVNGGDAVAGAGLVMVPLLHHGRLNVDLRVSLGARGLYADKTSAPARQSLTLTSEVGPVVNVRAAPWACGGFSVKAPPAPGQLFKRNPWRI